jgi:hypothetical protein
VRGEIEVKVKVKVEGKVEVEDKGEVEVEFRVKKARHEKMGTGVIHLFTNRSCTPTSNILSKRKSTHGV